MDLNFIDASDIKQHKATIQKTGRLSFNVEGSQYMGLKSGQHYKVAFESTDSEELEIYLVKAEKSLTTAQIYKSGLYYYLRLERPLRKAGIDFENSTYSYLIDEVDVIPNTRTFKLTLRKN